MVLGCPWSKLVDRNVAQLLGDVGLGGMEQRGGELDGVGQGGEGLGDGELGGHMVLVHKVQVHKVLGGMERLEYMQALDDKGLEMGNSHRLVGLECSRMGLVDERHQRQHRHQHWHILPQLHKGLSGNIDLK